MMKMQIISIVAMLLSQIEASQIEYRITDTCHRFELNTILQSQIGCGLRESPVALYEYTKQIDTPDGVIIQSIPNVVTVNRCNGNCQRTSHRCIPTGIKRKEVPVMLIMALYPQGIHETRCGHVTVEEHTGCDCNCPISAEDCEGPGNMVSRRYFDESHCQCTCYDREGRRECLAKSMEWDDETCECICPKRLWKMCSTGYVFDFSASTCKCSPTNMAASFGLIATISIMSLAIVVSMVGMMIMYKRRTGLFQHRQVSLSTQQLKERKDTYDKAIDAFHIQNEAATESMLVKKT